MNWDIVPPRRPWRRLLPCVWKLRGGHAWVRVDAAFWCWLVVELVLAALAALAAFGAEHGAP